MSVLLVGAGGHARAIVETLMAVNSPVASYVDPNHSDWLDARHFASDEDVEKLPKERFVLGIGGVSPEQLSRRHAVFRRYRDRGWTPRGVIHASAMISAGAKIGEGCIVLALAVVQPAAELGDAVIVNTGALVEHDSKVGAGSHVAPGAIVLGGCTIGTSCMIGAGSIVLQGATVPDNTLVPAGTRYPK